MQIKIPRRLVTWWCLAEDWLNEPFMHPRFLRVDALVIAFGGVNIVWWGYIAGWMGALYGTLLYTMIVMFALWFA